MCRIIFIETSTELCSVALGESGMLIDYKECGEPKAHASMTAVLINDMLQENGLTVADCDAVCVCAGPGSYTGLRVGVSTAKGLCFGANLPLISIGTLEVLVWQHISERANSEEVPISLSGDINFVKNKDEETAKIDGQDGGYTYKYIIPLIDARRMEVYTAIFKPDGTSVTQPEAKIIDENSFAEQLNEGSVLFIGDAAEKCSNVLTHPNACFTQCCPKASSMLIPATQAYKRKRFENLAYFEPAYLKDFQTTVSKKSLW